MFPASCDCIVYIAIGRVLEGAQSYKCEQNVNKRIFQMYQKDTHDKYFPIDRLCVIFEFLCDIVEQSDKKYGFLENLSSSDRFFVIFCEFR